jgi:hypothetical protein
MPVVVAEVVAPPMPSALAEPVPLTEQAPSAMTEMPSRMTVNYLMFMFSIPARTSPVPPTPVVAGLRLRPAGSKSPCR